MTIPFNKPFMTGKELYYIADAHFKGKLAGDGSYTKLCHEYLEKMTGAQKALLTHSCTAALEMSALLLNLKPGDEVIMPSYTFVSTANAFVLRGAVPVFVDVRKDTFNIDESLIEDAITEKTKAIVPVHYAGVGCEMDEIMRIAQQRDLIVVEDAAQGVMSTYKGRMLGSIGHLGAYSFHETKNVISGEGGALLVNDNKYVVDAEIIREKGTDRSRFFRGEVDKYTWQSVGSSYLPGELIAAFLWAQLEDAKKITDARLSVWNIYHDGLEKLELEGLLRRPIVPAECEHNAHMYYIVLPESICRDTFIEQLKLRGISPVFHYVSLHDSPAGKKYGRFVGDMVNTRLASEHLVRLPLWPGIKNSEAFYIVECINEIIKSKIVKK